MARLDCYPRVLAVARENGDAKGYRHCDGWRTTGKAELLRLYRQGKVSVALAVQAGAKPKDHLAAIDSGKVNVLDIVKAGIDLEALARVRKAQETREAMTPEKLAKQLERLKAENAALRAMQAQASVTIKTGDGQVAEVVAPKVAKPLSEHDRQVAKALFEAEERAKAKKAAEAKAKKGFTVTLTQAETQALIARNAAKPKPSF